MAEPEILILDEPTAGIDIGSKGEVLRLIRALAAEGKAILFISSELPELLSVSDRIAIMSAGRIVATMRKTELVSDARSAEETGFGAEHRLQLILQQGSEEWRT
jgi:ribose transport system ATP-binding protein